MSKSYIAIHTATGWRIRHVLIKAILKPNGTKIRKKL